MKRNFASALALVVACSIVVSAVILSLRFGRDDDDRSRVDSTRPPTHATDMPTPDAEAQASPHAVTRTTGVAESQRAVLRFDRWTTRFLCEIDPVARRALIAEGVAAAEERRRALYALMATDPESALKKSVPWAVRRTLPAAVDRWLEKRVSGVGDLLVVGSFPAADATADSFRAVRREVRIDGQSYDAYVAGRRSQLSSRSSIAIHGIAIGDRIAVSGSPLRMLEAGEPVPAGRSVEEICTVSGIASGPETKSGAQPLFAADTGDRIIYLCSAGHIAALEDALETAEAGGEEKVTAALSMVAAAPVSGDRSVMVIRVRFSDQVSGYEPQTEAAVLEMVSEASRFFTANSRGLFSIHAAVTPVYTLPQTSAWYVSNDTSGYARNVLEAARAVAANPSDYPGNNGLPAFNYLDHDIEVVRYTGGPGNFSGQAYVGVRGVWLKSSSAGVLAHEISHNLGLWHANAWIPDDPTTVFGPGRNSEYGDVFDTMGRNSGAHWHLNAYEKRVLGWLDATSILDPASVGGVARLEAHDLEDDYGAAGVRALKIRRDYDRDLWVEFRQHTSWAGNRWVMNGVGLRWDPWLSSNGGTQILDTNPLTADGFTDSPLVIGRTFSDAVADIHVTPVARVQGSVPAMEVDVQVGPFPGNHAPEVTLQASSSEADPGAVVTFSAVASDPDGDELSYSWELDDRPVYPSEPVINASFPVAGHKRVRVVVSDRKGLTRSASAVVKVGDPAGTLIEGRVVDAAGDPVPDVRIHNGVSIQMATHRQSFTDSAGRFALTDVPDGSWTITAERPGWIFARYRFLNPVNTSGDPIATGFIGEFTGYSVSGVVRGTDGTPVANAVVSDGETTELTDSSGAFVLRGVATGARTLNARKGDRIFGGLRVEVGYTDVSGVDLAEQTFVLSGEVIGVDPAVFVTITDGVRSTTAAPQTVGEGVRLVFSLAGVPAGIRNLVAISGDASFSPSNFTSPLLVAGDRSGLVFERDATQEWLITGQVTASGEGLTGVTISAGARSTTTDADGRYFLGGLEAGGAFVTASRTGVSIEPAGRNVTVLNGSVGGVDFTAQIANAAPYFTQPATLATDAGGPFVHLTAAADDDDGADLLRYTWNVVEGPAPGVVFLANGSHGARETIATFPAVGQYRIRVTASDSRGALASSDVTVHVPPVASRLEILPLPYAVWLGGTTRFSVRCTDQFGADMIPSDTVRWSVSGGGTIDDSGLFSAQVVGSSFSVRASMGDLAASGTFAIEYLPGPGIGITQEMWTGITGSTVAQLTSAPSFPAKPNVVSILGDLFESPSGYEHNYGQRLRGYFIPPASGDHVFYLASNNSSELWISPDGDPEHRSRAALVQGATALRDWEASAGQQTAPIALVEGQAVYLEVLHKEDSADDHLAVGVLLPGGVFERPIPAHRLMPMGEAVFDPPRIEIAASASPAIVDATLATTIRVSASSAGGASSLSYRWEAVGNAPAAVAFVPNGTNSARLSTARFTRAGAYELRVVVTDIAGQTAESSLQVVVRETLASWRLRHFSRSEVDTPSLEARLWGANADPDGDGVANLLEYAFGLDPLTPSREGLPTPGMITVDGVEYLSISFRRNPDATDVIYTPQASSDLRTWESGMQLVGDDPLADTLVYRDVRPAQELDKRFMRVQVTGP